MFALARVLQKVLLCTPLDKHVTGLRVREYFCVNIVALAKDNASNKRMFMLYIFVINVNVLPNVTLSCYKKQSCYKSKVFLFLD